jgi:hypothetical protein
MSNRRWLMVGLVAACVVMLATWRTHEADLRPSMAADKANPSESGLPDGGEPAEVRQVPQDVGGIAQSLNTATRSSRRAQAAGNAADAARAMEESFIRGSNVDVSRLQDELQTERFADFIDTFDLLAASDPGAAELTDLYAEQARQFVEGDTGATVERMACGATLCVALFRAPDADHRWPSFAGQSGFGGLFPYFSAIAVVNRDAATGSEYRFVFSTDPEVNGFFHSRRSVAPVPQKDGRLQTSRSSL